MAIKCNNGNNPTGVTYNGNTVREVWYKNTPSSTAVKVWPDTTGIYYSLVRGSTSVDRPGVARYYFPDYTASSGTSVPLLAQDSLTTFKYIYENLDMNGTVYFYWWNQVEDTLHTRISNKWYLNGATNPTSGYYTFANYGSAPLYTYQTSSSSTGSTYYTNSNSSDYESLISDFKANESMGYWVTITKPKGAPGLSAKFIWPDTNFTYDRCGCSTADFWGTDLNTFKIWVQNNNIAGVNNYATISRSTNPTYTALYIDNVAILTTASGQLRIDHYPTGRDSSDTSEHWVVTVGTATTKINKKIDRIDFGELSGNTQKVFITTK